LSLEVVLEEIRQEAVAVAEVTELHFQEEQK
jgi:hypothetical protein